MNNNNILETTINSYIGEINKLTFEYNDLFLCANDKLVIGSDIVRYLEISNKLIDIAGEINKNEY